MTTIVKFTPDVGSGVSFSGPNIFFDKLEGVGKVTVTDTATTGYRQDGSTLNYSQIDPREMTLNFYVRSKNNIEFLRKRDEVMAAFRPKTEGTLSYNDGIRDVAIRCHATSTPEIDKNKKIRMASGTVSLLANDPLFWDTKSQMLEITTWTGGFRLKTAWPFSLRTRTAPTKHILNDGHVVVPIEVRFKGPATNPMIRNMKTGDYIRLNQTLTSAQTLIINTDYNKKSVEIEEGGVLTNAYNYINLSSTFFYLAIGDNPIKYTSNDANQVNEVNVIYRRAYGGI